MVACARHHRGCNESISECNVANIAEKCVVQRDLSSSLSLSLSVSLSTSHSCETCCTVGGSLCVCICVECAVGCAARESTLEIEKRAAQ